MSRGSLKITRTDDYESSRRVDWLDSFARKIEQTAADPRTAVEAARQRDQKSVVDMIQAIMSGRPGKPNTVEGKVQDMQDRTGLQEYLRRVQSDDQSADVVKSGDQDEEGKETAKKDDDRTDSLPDSFSDLTEKTRDDVKNYINNVIETHHGNIHVPAIVESVIQTFRQNGVSPHHVNDVAFEKYISDRIVDQKRKSPAQEEHNTNIGKGIGVDNDLDGNDDMFEGLMPVKS